MSALPERDPLTRKEFLAWEACQEERCEFLDGAAAAMLEVLPDSTARQDLIVKNRAYRTLDSVMRCVIVDQDSLNVQSIQRTAEGWLHAILSGHDAVPAFPPLGVTLPLADLHADTEVWERVV